MSLCDYRVSGSDCGSKIPSGSTIEGERKVVRAEDANRTYGSIHGANAGRGIDDGLGPRAVARGTGSHQT